MRNRLAVLVLLVLFAGCAHSTGDRVAQDEATVQRVANPLENPAFFPRAVWFIEARHAPLIAELGCNMYVCGGFFRRPIEDMDAVWKHGLYNITQYYRDPEVRHRVRSHPSFVAWSNENEPDLARRVARPERLEELYRRIKSGEASGPVYLNFTHPMGNIFAQRNSNDWYRRYCAAADILMYDYYPNNLAPMGRQRQWLVAVGMDRLARFGGTAKPRWNWIECTNISNAAEGPAYRVPTFEDIRAQVWISIIHGASGVGYFTHAWERRGGPNQRGWHEEVLIPEPQQKALKLINSELARLAPVINSAPPDYPVGKVEAGEGRIDLALRHDGKDLYIFAANMRQMPEMVAFSLPGLRGRTKAEVLGEDRTLAVRDGCFSDRFAGFDVNLYRLPLGELPRVPPRPEPPWLDKVEEGFEERLGPRWDVFHDVVRSEELRHSGLRSLAVVPYSRVTWQVARADRFASVDLWVCTGDEPAGDLGPYFGLGNTGGDLVLLSPKGGRWQLTFTADDNFQRRHDLDTPETKSGEWTRWTFAVGASQLDLQCDGRPVRLPEGIGRFFATGLTTLNFIGDERGKDSLWVDDVTVTFLKEGRRAK